MANREDVEAAIRILNHYNELGTTDTERLQVLLPLLDAEGVVPALQLCSALFDSETADARLRSFIGRVNEAAEASENRAREAEEEMHEQILHHFRMVTERKTSKRPKRIRVTATVAPRSIELSPSPNLHYRDREFVQTQGTSDRTSLRLFISYATVHRAELEQFRKIFDQVKLAHDPDYEFEIWSDSALLAGRDFDEGINSEMAACDYGLGFVSEEILNSNYILNTELPHFLRRDCLVPVSFIGDCRELQGEIKRRAALYQNDTLTAVANSQWVELKDREPPSSFEACVEDEQRQLFVKNLLDKIIQRHKSDPEGDKHRSENPQVEQGYTNRQTQYQLDKGEDTYGVPNVLENAFDRVGKKGSGQEEAGLRDRHRVNVIDDMLEWMANQTTRLYALLGEFGMGKTFTCRQFAERLNRDADSAVKAFYIDLRDTPTFIDRSRGSTVPNLEDIIDSILQLYPDSKATAQSVIQSVQAGQTIIIFDGLDERLTQFNKAMQADYLNRILTVFTTQASERAKVIVSCRSHFFESQLDISRFFTQQQRGPVDADSYRCVTLQPFSEEQIRNLLNKKLGANEASKAWQLLAEVREIKALATRPYLLDNIIKLLPDLMLKHRAGTPIGISTIYNAIIEDSLNRDDDKLILQRRHKRRFLRALAYKLWIEGRQQMGIHELNDWYHVWLLEANLHPLYGERYDLEVLEKDLRNSSLLVHEGKPNDQGNDAFQFGHSSLQEYLVAEGLVEQLRLGNSDWPANPSRECLRFVEDLILKLQPRNLSEVLEGISNALASPSANNLTLLELLSSLSHRIDIGKIPIVSIQGEAKRRLRINGLNIGRLIMSKCDLPRSRWMQMNVDNLEVSDVSLEDSTWLGCTISKLGTVSRFRTQGLSALPALPVFDKVLHAQSRNYAKNTGGHLHADRASCQIGHSASVCGVALSADGQWIVSGSDDNTVKLWSVDSGTCTQTFSGHESSVSSVALSADGQWIVSGSRDKTVKLWSVDSGTCTQTFSGHESRVSSVALSADGQWIVSGSYDDTVKLWSVDSGTCTQTFSGHESRVSSVALSADGQWIVSGSHDDTVKLWSVDSGTCTQTFSGHESLVLSVALSADGQWIVSGSDDNTVKLWSVDSGTCTQTFSGHESSVSSVALSADGQWIVSGSRDKTVKLWSVDSGTCTQTFSGHESRVSSVALSADGQWIVSGSYDDTVKLWSVDSGTCTQTFSGHESSVSSVTLSADGQWIVSGSRDKTVKLWSVDSGTCTQTFSGHESLVLSVALSADGQWIVSGSYDDTVKLWSVDSGTCTQTFSGHESLVLSVALSADGQWIVSGSDDNTVKLWSVDSGTCTQTFSGHESRVMSVALSADGQWIVSGSHDDTVKLWSVDSGTCTQTFSGHESRVSSVALSADGQWIVSGSHDDTVKLWSVDSGTCTQTFSGHESLVLSVALSADGQWIVSGSDDNTVKLWSVDSGTCTQTFSGHESDVNSVTLSADGQWIASASRDGTCRVSGAQSGDAIATIYHLKEQWAYIDHVSGQLNCTESAWRYLNGSDGKKGWPLEEFKHTIFPSEDLAQGMNAIS